MRSLRSRLELLLNIKTSAVLDQAEDPREVFAYAYNQQRWRLRTIRRGLIEVAAARRHLEHEAERLRARVRELEEQARRAVKMQRDDLARGALERKHTTLAQIRNVETHVAEISAQEERMVAAEQQISQAVEAFRARRTVATARYTAAQAQVVVGEASAGVASDEAVEIDLAVERSEDRIERLEARAAALETLGDSPGVTNLAGEDAIERELDRISNAEAIERELAELKRQISEEQAP
jgi:phage shock protein A